MDKNYPELTRQIAANLKKLRKDIPDTMQGFSALAQAATRDGALDRKTKELMALALGVAAHCDGCIGFHVEALVRLHATRQEIEETLGMAVYMGGGPSLMYAADAIAAFEQFEKELTDLNSKFGEDAQPPRVGREPPARTGGRVSTCGRDRARIRDHVINGQIRPLSRPGVSIDQGIPQHEHAVLHLGSESRIAGAAAQLRQGALPSPHRPL